MKTSYRHGGILTVSLILAACTIVGTGAVLAPSTKGHAEVARQSTSASLANAKTPQFTIASAACSGQSKMFFRVDPSTNETLGFMTVHIRRAKSRSHWDVVVHEIRGDDVDVEEIDLRASRRGVVVFADELSHPGRVLIEFRGVSNAGQDCSMTLRLSG